MYRALCLSYKTYLRRHFPVAKNQHTALLFTHSVELEEAKYFLCSTSFMTFIAKALL